MARSWLIDPRGFAEKVKGATLSSASQLKDCGATRECPKCHYLLDNSDVSIEWPGLPAGVKFNPSDAQLLEHLAAKCGVRNSKPHMFIDAFIPTLEEDKGICYTHPENLPGANKDGSSVHFFHRTINAYATGQRKRRKIHNQHDPMKEHVRWHKTGKTKPVAENGIQKGCKKILVLYRSSKKGTKPDKSNWVMHQYHLGTEEDEKEGEYVVSKIFFQQQKQNDTGLVIEECNIGTIQTSPRTPKTNTPNPPRPGKSVSCDDFTDDNIPQVSVQEAEVTAEASHQRSSTIQLEDDMVYSAWLAGESQAVENSDQKDDLLLCKEIFDSCTPLDDSVLNPGPSAGLGHNRNDLLGEGNHAICGIADLENLELDTPPDFQLADLQFGSQDSILGWLDRI